MWNWRSPIGDHRPLLTEPDRLGHRGGGSDLRLLHDDPATAVQFIASVAIAVALVPPLCFCGIGLSLGPDVVAVFGRVKSSQRKQLDVIRKDPVLRSKVQIILIPIRVNLFLPDGLSLKGRS